MNAPAKIKPTLNEGQQKAADAFFEFLFTDEIEFDIRGPGGVGKTFLMGYLIDEVIPRYEQQCKLMGIDPVFKTVEMTATTNKAAEALEQATKRPVSTIYSFLCLKVQNDYKTGAQKIARRKDWKPKKDVIVFIDEGSMIDSNTYFEIHAALQNNCKIVYVGDQKQLPPVMERISPIYKNGIRHTQLTENVRAAAQPALLALCQQYRDTVDTLDFKPIQTVPGVIDHFTDDQLEAEIDQRFAQQNQNDRILCYTNKRVRAFSDHIRNVRGLPDHLTQGEILVCSAPFQTSKFSLSVESEVKIARINDNTEEYELNDGGHLTVRRADLSRNGAIIAHGVPIPEDMDHYHRLTKWYARQKDWGTYFQLKEGFPDLRPRDASTVYKAQGSTYDTVIIDLGDIGTSNNPQQVAHMLYVAVSRPRSRIILFGDLPAKYGGLSQ